MGDDIVIRTATLSDVPDLLEIYRPYVENTAISFEYEVPSEAEFKKRVETILKKYPYLVAVSGDEVAGYAYASEFKGRRAYDWAVEVSIYLKQGCQRKGYGRKLYLALETVLKQQHILNVNACITYVEQDDGYANDQSMKFHEHMGYRFVGRFYQCGYKFGRWYDMIWMEKMIGEHTAKPDEVIPFGELAQTGQVKDRKLF